jgi:hypothetical protein
MAVSFFTDSPQWLLNEFNKRIEQKEPKDKITTWERSSDGKYYTHKSDEWRKKAWFKPSVETGRLIFNIIKPKDRNVTKVVYGYYHGHLIETFLNHFDHDFTKAEATALQTSGDHCSSDD